MSTATAAPTNVRPGNQANDLGYHTFTAGQFRFARDEYFAHIYYPGGRHVMHIDAFLRAVMRDVGWGFFYGTVNFDNVLGTLNHYGTVDLFVGLLNEAYRSQQPPLRGDFQFARISEGLRGNAGRLDQRRLRPLRRSRRDRRAYGPKHGNNTKALKRQRIVAKRMVGLPGDLEYRTDENGQPVNRQFLDVPQDSPEDPRRTWF